jgi:hypothetical protein
MERLWYGVTHGFPRRHERLGLRSIRVPRVGSKSWLYASIGASYFCGDIENAQ